jgi:hypothetical protein
MKKIGLVAGCSHSAGSEMDGTEDSYYNRQNAFGSLLCKSLGYEPINIALGGAANSGIARSILLWFDEFYKKDEMDVFVVIGWTESSRLEVPAESRLCYYNEANSSADWYDASANYFHRINFGWMGATEEEQIMIPIYQNFMANNPSILENWSATSVLQIQYFLKSLNVKYVMSNTMHMFQPDNDFTKFLISQIDKTRYFNLLTDQNMSFYWKYANLGYENKKATYWHHDEEPHRLYAEELLKFLEDVE